MERLRRFTFRTAPRLVAVGSSILLASCVPQSTPRVEQSISSSPVPIEPTVILTSTATPTEVPTVTLTVVPTSTFTPEPTPTPKIERSPLPTYGVFRGSFTDKGAPGAIVIASVPLEGIKDYILVYYTQARPDGRGSGSSLFVIMETVKLQDKTFQALLQPKGYTRLEATLDDSNKTLIGVLSYIAHEEQFKQPGETAVKTMLVPGWEQKFKANSSGTGKAATVASIQWGKNIGYRLGVADISTVGISGELGRVQIYKDGKIQPFELPG